MLDDRGAELAQLGRGGGDPVALVVTQDVDAADPRRPGGVQRKRAGGQGGVGHVGQVEVDAAQRTCPSDQSVVLALLDRGAHAREHLAEASATRSRARAARPG
ncbi:hypothetical protein OV090_40010 [Nannocystis sp. RBIL2]|uniref:hypothetical protein n=1 Tax=Nannocystis sp. RBIL2 TaxID=2996788 RepID=UPI00226EE4B4|nr:hypothetical protein [Nannocystis sp. RBIL2]MCY1070995.1 hypothetical protein [Nannocystis sp. RBIL2]